MLIKQKLKLRAVIIIYIGVILIFSLIYYKMPNKSFFHSTVKYDTKYMQNDTIIVLQEIDNAIRDDIKSNINQINNNLTIEEFSAKNLNIKEYPNNVIVNFSVKYKYSKENTILQGLNYKVHLDMSNYIKMNYKEYIYFTVDYNKITIDPKIFPTIDGNSIFRTNDININANYLTLNNEIANRITSIYNAYIGFPDNLSGKYLRMLYFSFGIATTLTLGDILPVTEFARIVVLIQNIITIITIAIILDTIVKKLEKI